MLVHVVLHASYHHKKSNYGYLLNVVSDTLNFGYHYIVHFTSTNIVIHNYDLYAKVNALCFIQCVQPIKYSSLETETCTTT